MVEKNAMLQLEKLESSKSECGGHNNLNISVAEEANNHEGDLYVNVSCLVMLETFFADSA
jgi:hypothetical protein